MHLTHSPGAAVQQVLSASVRSFSRYLTQCKFILYFPVQLNAIARSNGSLSSQAAIITLLLGSPAARAQGVSSTTVTVPRYPGLGLQKGALHNGWFRRAPTACVTSWRQSGAWDERRAGSSGLNLEHKRLVLQHILGPSLLNK